MPRVRRKKESFIGSRIESTSSGFFKIIGISGSRFIVEFEDTGTVKEASHTATVNGLVRDSNRRSHYGVGFIGVGKYKPSIKQKHTKEYAAWMRMLCRCYSENDGAKRFYSGCTVCDEWHNFQVFAEWYSSRWFDGCHLDKDIKYPGNKVYSPEACSVVSGDENISAASRYRMKPALVQDQDGVVHLVVNRSKFAKENSLNHSQLCNMLVGRGKSCQGWRVYAGDDYQFKLDNLMELKNE